MEGLYLPPQRIPLKFFNRLRSRGDWQIGDQLPFNGIAATWLAALGRMQHGEFERRVTTLLANRRQYVDPAELELKDRFGHVPATIAHFDSVQSLAINLCYLGGNGVLAVACETIHAGAQEKVRASILSLTEEFVDIAFAIPNVHASCRIAR